MSTSPSNTTTLTVSGMTCSHCVAAVTSELSKLERVTGVEIDLATGLVTVDSDQPVNPATIAAAVECAGYVVAVAGSQPAIGSEAPHARRSGRPRRAHRSG
jgi:copper chaperone